MSGARRRMVSGVSEIGLLCASLGSGCYAKPLTPASTLATLQAAKLRSSYEAVRWRLPSLLLTDLGFASSFSVLDLADSSNSEGMM